MVRKNLFLCLPLAIAGCALVKPFDSSNLSSRAVGKWQAEVVCKKMGVDTRGTIMFKLNPGDLPYSQHGLMVYHHRDAKERYLGFSTYFVMVNITPFIGDISVDIDRRIAGKDMSGLFRKIYNEDPLKRGQFVDNDSMKLNICGRVETFKRIADSVPLDVAPPLEAIDYN